MEEPPWESILSHPYAQGPSKACSAVVVQFLPADPEGVREIQADPEDAREIQVDPEGVREIQADPEGVREIQVD